MLFPLYPFASAPISDGYTPPQSVHVVTALASSNYWHAEVDGARYRSPLEPERQNFTPQHSPFDRLAVPPLMLPSGTR